MSFGFATFSFLSLRLPARALNYRVILAVDASHTRAAGSRIVFATQARVAPRSVSALHHHFPFASTRPPHALNVDSAVALIVRLLRAFTSRSFPRAVIIVIEIGRDNYAAR